MATVDQLLKSKLTDLIAQRDKEQARLLPHREKVNAVYAEIQTLRDSIAADSEAIRSAMPALATLENEISKLARALGGKSMSDAA